MFRFDSVKFNEPVMEKIYRFRCKILCEELKYFDIKNFPQNKEFDIYDRYAKHYVAYDQNHELIAYTRFIFHSPYGYPMTEHMEIDKKYRDLDREKISEISRVFIKKEYRRIKNTKTILKTFMNDFIYPDAKKNGIEYFYSALQKNFLLLLLKIKFPFKTVGKIQEYGGKRFPTIMNIKDYEKQNPKVIEKWRNLYENF